MPVGGITQALTGVLIGRLHRPLSASTSIRTSGHSRRRFPLRETSVRQVLAHATDGRFRYDPALYSSLTPVVESLHEAVVSAGDGRRSARARDAADDGARFRVSISTGPKARPRSRCSTPPPSRAISPCCAEVAVPYRIDAKGRSHPLRVSVVWPRCRRRPGLDGVRSRAVRDRARQRDGARAAQLQHARQDVEQRRSSRINGVDIAMPTGLGWFVTTESGQRLVWTFGHIQDASSALIVKIVRRRRRAAAKRLTLIMLANSGGLAQGLRPRERQRHLLAVRESLPAPVHLSRRLDLHR